MATKAIKFLELHCTMTQFLITTDINAAGNAVNVKTLKEQLANYLHIDGSKAMTGDLDIGSKNVLNLENLTDYKVDDPIDY